MTQFKEPMLIGTLAAACAEAGRFEDAVNAAHKARELALAAGLEQVAEKNRELTEWFKARKAYREPR